MNNNGPLEPKKIMVISNHGFYFKQIYIILAKFNDIIILKTDKLYYGPLNYKVQIKTEIRTIELDTYHVI